MVVENKTHRTIKIDQTHKFLFIFPVLSVAKLWRAIDYQLFILLDFVGFIDNYRISDLPAIKRNDFYSFFVKN